MNKEFIPYQEALALKELGFDEPCIKGFYNKEPIYTVVTTPVDFNSKKQLGELISAPLYQQAFRWFREKGYVSYVEVLNTGKYDYMLISKNFTEVVDFNDGSFDTYEEAELECLRQLIEIVKQQKLIHDLMSGDIVGY